MKIIKFLIYNEYDDVRLFWWLFIPAFLAIGLFILMFNLWIWGTSGNFEYQDFSDNYGYAIQCYESRGQLICITSDNSKIAVKSYRRLDE